MFEPGPLQSLLLWLDAEPARYWVTAWTVSGATGLAAAFASDDPARGAVRRRFGKLGFAFLILATLAAFRWPAWPVRAEFNPDESLSISGAITLREHFVPWKYTDTGSHGPVAETLLVAMAWLGAPLDHVTARILAILLQALSLIAAWRVLAGFTSERIARLGILPGLAFWAFISWVDFVHYAMELPGITLVALGAWALTPALSDPEGRTSPVRLFLGGAALGTTPLSKLQLVPLAGALGLLALGLLARRFWRTRRPGDGRPAMVLLTGALTPLLLLAVYLLVYGLVGQFWRAYILSAFDYTADGHYPFREMGGWFFHFSATAFGFAWFFWGTLAFCLLFARQPDRAFRGPLLAAWTLLGVAMYCVLRPSREVAHYLHILVIPLTLLAGLTLAAGSAAVERRAPLGLFLAFALLALLPQIHHRAITGVPHLGYLQVNLSKPPSQAATYLLQHRHPGDTLAMWGWEPILFVETGMVQGTREAAIIYPNPRSRLRDFYVGRYKSDLLRRRPAWFVDAVGPGSFVYEDRATYGHETIPEISEVIARDYELVADMESKRIYKRRADPSP